MHPLDLLRWAKRKLFSKYAKNFPIDAWTDPAYEKWFLSHKTSLDELAAQKATEFGNRPVFSIIVPLFKTPIGYLTIMTESVLGQTYGEFELILVNASPEDAELAAAVEAIAGYDDRVKEVSLDANYGITENTNYGIDAATGDFMCFLDHDDFIEPDLLFEYAKALNECPEIDVLYCDEDLVEVDGEVVHYVHPLFKPAYSPELLLCKNYIVHLMTIRSEIVRSMPRPDSSYDGAQDYNMVLFATSHARRVHGVQKVLYHWRMSDESTAAKPSAKPYSQRAYRKSAFRRIKDEFSQGSVVSSGIVNIHNVWFSGSDEPIVSIVVDCEDDPDGLGAFFEGFEEANGYSNYEIIPVVCAGSAPAVEGFANVREMLVCEGGRFNRLNAAARRASGEFILFLSSKDVLYTPEAIKQLFGLCSHSEVGVVAAKSLYFDNSVKSYGIAVTPERIMPLYRGYPDDFPAYQCNTRAFQNLSAVSWNGMMVSRKLFNRIGGFDASYEGEIGSADFCHRAMNAGFRVVQIPTIKIQTGEMPPERRYDRQANSSEFTEADLALFDDKWPGVREAGDPYFNKNLDQASGYYQVDSPRRR